MFYQYPFHEIGFEMVFGINILMFILLLDVPVMSSKAFLKHTNWS